MWALFVACAVATLSPCSGARSPPTSSEVEDVIRHIKDTRRELHGIYGEDVDPSIFSLGVDFFDEASRDLLVKRLMGAFRQGGSFVVAFGGMSDVAGHGNLFEESYPNVFGRALAGVFDAAGITFEARNLAMGGVPSYPNSACMGDNFGRDADVIVWDFRMVEVKDRAGKECFDVASTWVISKQRPRGTHPRFEVAPRDDRSSKNEPKRVENDRDASLQSWDFLSLFLPRSRTP